jgi:hypothetical protein
MMRTDGITFQVHATAEYLGLGFPKKIPNWKNQFFYMREDTPAGQVACHLSPSSGVAQGT